VWCEEEVESQGEILGGKEGLQFGISLQPLATAITSYSRSQDNSNVRHGTIEVNSVGVLARNASSRIATHADWRVPQVERRSKVVSSKIWWKLRATVMSQDTNEKKTDS
jgi:hypothetical protein